jgi:hypothetical protein
MELVPYQRFSIEFLEADVFQIDRAGDMVWAHLERTLVAAEGAQFFDRDVLPGPLATIHVGKAAALVKPLGGSNARDVEGTGSALAAMCEFDQDMVGGEAEAMCGRNAIEKLVNVLFSAARM